MHKSEGVLPASVTSFTDGGKVVEEERLPNLVNHHIELSSRGRSVREPSSSHALRRLENKPSMNKLAENKDKSKHTFKYTL